MTAPQPFDLASHAIGPGLSVIEASAGTGKTWSLSHLVVDALLEDPALTLDQVLVVTFTNAAADELAGRVRGVLDEVREIVEAAERPSATREMEDLPSATRRSQESASDCERLQTPDPRPQTTSGAATLLARRSGAYEPADLARRIRALRQNLDQVQVHTIHGFCRRVLERCAFECGAAFDLELAIDLADLHQQVVDDGWRRALVDRPLLAAIAQLDGWTPEKDLAVVKPTTRLDRWTTEPADLDLDRELAAVVDAWAEVRRAWSPGLATQLGTLKWNKAGAEWATQVADLGRAVAEDGGPDSSLATLPPGGLRAARWLAADRLHDDGVVHAKDVAKLADLPALVACQTLARALDRVRPAWLSGLLAWFPGAVATAKRLARRRSSDDLLLEVAAALDGERGPALRTALRDAHRVVLIDEFQDTDPVQWGIFARCFAEPPTRLVLIGDPKQAIYGFRGCDLKTYLRAVAGVAPWHLATNFRSAPTMVAAVNALFAGAQPFADPAIAFHAATSAANAKGSSAPLVDDGDGDGAALRFVLPTNVASGAADGLGAWIASEFRRLLGRATLGDRPLRPGDLAVLVRSNAQAVTVREHLRQAGLPAVIAEQEDLLAAPAAKDLLALLGAVLEPRQGNRLRAALATRLGGFDAEALVALNHDDGRWQAVLEQVASIARTWRERGVAAAVERLLHEPWLADLDQAGPESAAVRLAGGPDGERHLMDLRHAGEWLAAEADEGHLGPVALLRTVAQARRNPAGEERRRRLESDAEAVQVVTMHKAKGLEYPVVACPFLWNSRDSDQDEALVVRGDDGATVIDLGSLERERRLADRVADRLAEDLRLAYVALTRARNRTYVAWGPLSSSKIRPILSSALGWLLRPGGDTAESAQLAWEARLKLDVKKATDRPDPARILAEPVERLAQAQPGVIGIEWWDPEAEPAASPRPESGVRSPESGAAGSSVEANADAGAAAAVHSSFIDHHSSFPAERVPRPWRISSFTALTSQRGQRHATEPDDRPQADDPARSRSEAGDDAAALARGAALGTCLHGLLERSRGVTVPPAEEIREALHRAGLADPTLHQGRDPVAVVGAILERVPTLALGGATLAEADLLRPEWPFHLPVAELSVAAIARAFRDHGGPLAATSDALTGLDSHQLAGAFTGIVDLIVRWPVTDGGSHWAVLDWKTNHLGPDASAYTAEALEQSMAEHRYVLQGCLYLVALRRWLRHRDPTLPTDWTGDLHYVYLRGLGGPQGGVWTARPAVGLLDALETAFGGMRCPL